MTTKSDAAALAQLHRAMEDADTMLKSRQKRLEQAEAEVTRLRGVLAEKDLEIARVERQLYEQTNACAMLRLLRARIDEFFEATYDVRLRARTSSVDPSSS